MSHSDRLRAGVIGLGWAGQQHIPPGTPQRLMLILLLWREWRPMGCSNLATDTTFHSSSVMRTGKILADHGTLDVLSIAAPTILHAPIAMAAP